MPDDVNWIKILIECKNNVQRDITPLLSTRDSQQPDLGVGAGGDPIKMIDLTAEKAIVDTLKRKGIEFTLISEESGIVKYSVSSPKWYVTTDPIDGTTNLLRGAPFYATSIAVSSQLFLKSICASLVADLSRGTTYTAQKGCGAYRNDHRILPSRNVSVEEGVIGIDLNSFRIEKLVPKLTALMSVAKHLRHFGANALELCYVADGTIDAFVDIRGKLRTTDIAASYLIILEAGGIMSAPDGSPVSAKLDPKRKVEFIAAANEGIYQRIMKLVNPEKEAT
jgi:myo-inositol-1(or 4)-monophosphatase